MPTVTCARRAPPEVELPRWLRAGGAWASPGGPALLDADQASHRPPATGVPTWGIDTEVANVSGPAGSKGSCPRSSLPHPPCSPACARITVDVLDLRDEQIVPDARFADDLGGRQPRPGRAGRGPRGGVRGPDRRGRGGSSPTSPPSARPTTSWPHKLADVAHQSLARGGAAGRRLRLPSWASR